MLSPAAGKSRRFPRRDGGDPISPAHPHVPSQPAALGLTIVELLIAVVLAGLVLSAVYRVLLGAQRVHRLQWERVELRANVRAVASMIPLELLELNATDTLGSDLLSLEDTIIAYKAMRRLYFICQRPVSANGTGVLQVWQRPSYGMRQLDPNRDSLMVYAEAGGTIGDDYWLHASLRGSPTAGNACPGSAPSWELLIDGIRPALGLADVRPGAPVRGVEAVQITSYPDARGDWWLGLRQHNKSTGWTRIQPLVGPVHRAGVTFRYLDRDGAAALDTQAAARVSVSVVGRSARMVRTWTGGLGYLRDTVRTAVALRGNSRW